MSVVRYIERIYVAMVAMAALVLSSCAVHEWPGEHDPEVYDLTLHLDYSTELPLYKVVEHQLSRAEVAESYDVRYIIEVYATPQERSSSYRFLQRKIVSRDDVSTLAHSVDMTLPAGFYTFKVWTDYVDAGTVDNKFYNANDFTKIRFEGDYVANNDFRDAFVGSLDVEVTPTTTDLIIGNMRPLAKFNVVTTDLERFVEHMLELKAQESQQNDEQAASPGGSVEDGDASSDEPTRVVDISEYRVVFKYATNLPNEFHVFRNEPVDVANPNTVTFDSSIKKISESEAELGFDYVFVNGNEIKVHVVIEVFDKDNVSVSCTEPIPVPMVRSKLTTVRGEFLTSQASGGVGINPGFDGPDFIYDADAN